MRLPRLVTRSLEERMVRDAEWRVRAELGHLEALRAKVKRAEAELESNGGDDRLTLHSVTFEQLRDLGLSVTESTRLLAARHRGKLPKLSDLDHVRLTRDSLQTLKRALSE